MKLKTTLRSTDSSASRTFLETRIKSIPRPSEVDPPLQYASEVDLFVPSEKKEAIKQQQITVFSAARTEMEHLCKDVLMYQEKVNTDSKSLVNIRAFDSTHWREVESLVRSQKTRAHGESAEASKERSCRMKILEYLPAFEAWLELLPDDAYGSVISGTFKLILGAFKKSSEVKVEVFKAMADIPEHIALAQRYRRLYESHNPTRLMQKTADLCTAIMSGLRRMVAYLAEGTLKGAIKAFFQGPCYEKPLLEQLDLIKTLTQTLDREAAVLSQESIQSIEVSTKSMLRKMSILEQQNGEEAKEDFAQRVAMLLTNTMYQMLTQQGFPVRSSSPLPQIVDSQAIAEVTPVIAVHEVVNVQQLQRSLSYLPESPTLDLQRCLRTATSLSLDAHDRMKWCMQSVKLQMWLKQSTSKGLLINGNLDSETSSPLTLLMSKLAQTLGTVDKDRVLCIQYHCSLHPAPTAQQAGVARMLKSLIGQILSQKSDWDLSFVDTKLLVSLPSDLDALCQCLNELLSQVPDDTLVFCMIDGVNLYERWPNAKPFEQAVTRLANMLHDHQNITMKLLLTCPTHARLVTKLFDAESILNMPSEIDGDSQGWSQQAWKGFAGLERLTVESAK